MLSQGLPFLRKPVDLAKGTFHLCSVLCQMGTSCPVTGQENSWRARRWVFCISSSRQGLGNRPLPSSIDSKMHIFGSLKSGLNSQTVASYPYCRSEVKAGVPEDDHTDSARHWGHPASNCLMLDSLLEVLLFLFCCCCCCFVYSLVLRFFWIPLIVQIQKANLHEYHGPGTPILSGGFFHPSTQCQG